MPSRENLRLRRSHRYVGTCQHKDQWQYLGHMKVLERRCIFSNEGYYESLSQSITVVLDSKTARLPGRLIKQALMDSFTKEGCHHEYDCCGCWSYSAWLVKRTGRRTWSVKVSGRPNY